MGDYFTTRLPPKFKVKFGDQVITLYGIGWLAMLCRISSQALRWWERRGLLPKPILTVATKDRFYTTQELLHYSQIILAHRDRTKRRGVKITQDLVIQLVAAKSALVKKFKLKSGILAHLANESAFKEIALQNYRKRQMKRIDKNINHIMEEGKI
jgi:DNA-binding transcriptional MerR regulator